MESDIKLEKLKKALKHRNCTVKKHSNVMEITFENEGDANWFESIFEYYQKESAVCCLMPIRPKNAPSKFIFNVKDMNLFIELIKED